MAVMIDKSQPGDIKTRRGRRILIINIVFNLLIIGFFKYADFLMSIISQIPGVELKSLNIPLPLGISFFTFQIVSYVIDVYNKKVASQKNLLFLGTYIIGFQHLVAGPIVRYETIAYELENRTENIREIADGLRRFTAGLAKKVLIANNMAVLCDTIWAYEPSRSGAVGMWIAVVAYTMQIYYDFSGYSDMAIGLGKMMGFHYLENFNYPYISQSVTDFWRRWHISLSTFFRDYIYIPMGGNRVKTSRWILNMMTVWLLTGLWHGAAWTFILWGVYYGVLLIIEKLLLQNTLVKIPVLRNIYALAAIMFGWIIFRSDSAAQIGVVVKTMFGAYGSGSFIGLVSAGAVRPMSVIAGIAGIIYSMPASRRLKDIFLRKPYLPYVYDAAAIAIMFLCILTLAQGSYNPFIYFRF